MKASTPTSPLTSPSILGNPPTGRGKQVRAERKKAEEEEGGKWEEEGRGIKGQGHGWQHPPGIARKLDLSSNC